MPERGHGEPGDIIALGHLLRPRISEHVEIGERMSPINGPPVAAGLPADAVVTGRDRVAPAEEV
ncbi:hypothetical protein, partial [Pseudonocardia abyssalis]|uniref:hypothetical protein n=1 Tax=Pseudonocardia abyssalis TaxID=2792008 RepID=UPI001C49FF46